MDVGVELRVEITEPLVAGTGTWRLQLLGALSVLRAGVPLVLPPSRKVRALLAYLAMAPRGVTRSTLCELLWDLPNDPRGELRWCLSKARALLGEAGRERIVTAGDTIRLDLTDATVDALDVNAAVQAGLATASVEHLRRLADHCSGDFLQGLDIHRSAPFSAWLTGQRRHFRAAHAAILEHLVGKLPPDADEVLGHLERWLRLAPFDRRVHGHLLDTLARRGQLREGDEHLAIVAKLFDAEGQDWAPIGHAWRIAKSRHSSPTRAAVVDVATPLPVDPVASSFRRASIVVMPFAEPGTRTRGGLADGLVHDVITRLAKLRSLFVIAQGTVFALDERSIDAQEAGRTLNVDYVVSGTVHREARMAHVAVQLTETRTARVLWADVLHARPGDETFAVLELIGNRVVSSVASHVEMAERNRAILKAPNSLDAWGAYHRGQWHMTRFDREDNDKAHRYFESAVKLDPTFARPYAGLSFTHFQRAFLGWGERTQETELAYRAAAEGLMADDRDPAAHWAMGRALWLRGDMDQSMAELDTSVELSPNFALGFYSLGFVHAQLGDAQAAIRATDHARDLSPFDPLLFAMLATRAMALMRLGRHDEAADWAVKAIVRPNAHAHILGIAAHCLELAGRHDEALKVADALRRKMPGYRGGDFLTAFRFPEEAGLLLGQAAQRIGLA